MQTAAGCLDRSFQVCVQAVQLLCLQTEETDTIFEFLVRDDNAQWQHWKECVPSWEYPKKQERPKFAQLVIPTLDSVRYEKLLMLCYSVQKVSRQCTIELGELLKHHNSAKSQLTGRLPA